MGEGPKNLGALGLEFGVWLINQQHALATWITARNLVARSPLNSDDMYSGPGSESSTY